MGLYCNLDRTAALCVQPKDEIKIYAGYFRFPVVISLVIARAIVHQARWLEWCARKPVVLEPGGGENGRIHSHGKLEKTEGFKGPPGLCPEESPARRHACFFEVERVDRS